MIGVTNLNRGSSTVTSAVDETTNAMIGAGIKGDIDYMLITLESQILIIRPSAHNEGLFLYLVLDKAKSNLALARRKVHGIEGKLEV